jgi:Xaa-Pro aminopeptidase
LTDARDSEVAEGEAAKVAARSSADGGFQWQLDDTKGKFIPSEIHEILDFSSIKRLAVEDTISQRTFAKLQEIFTQGPESAVDSVPSDIDDATSADDESAALDLEFVAVTNWVEDIRRSKDEAEAQRIAAAQAITDEAFKQICDFIQVGMSEAEVALELEFTIRRIGAEALSFPSIVASGPNSSLPHAHPGERKLQPGDLLTLDFGASYHGYCSDMTRTVFISGELADESQAQPSTQQRRVYDTVLEAQQKSLATIKAGVTASDVDKAGRDVITAAGYGEYFGHGTGHGVGLEIHEAPNVGPRSKGELEVGDVVTVEPGIYLPGKYGVRIEDLVLVTKDGVRNFTKSPKELLII